MSNIKLNKIFKTVCIASDHAGFDLKEDIKNYLINKKVSIFDLGPYSDHSVDYPDYASKVLDALLGGNAERGILVCGTGQGMAMSANKVAGVRAAVVSDTFSAQMAMEHNQAKILCLGERVVGPSLALACVDTWLAANFQAGRHERRVNKIEALGQ